MQRTLSITLVLACACGGAPPQPEELTFVDMPEERVVGRRPPPEPMPPVAEPLGLVPAPPPLPAFGARAALPSEVLVEGWHAAQRIAVDHPPPAPPAERSLAAVQRWAETDLGAWLTARRTALAAAETTLNRVAEGGSRQEQGVAAAMVARIFDDFLHELTRSAVIPDEIVNDEELLAVYARAIWNGAAPLRARALDTLTFCARTLASGPEGWWTPWGAYCEERRALLERAPDEVPMAAVAERIAAWRVPAVEADAALTPLPALDAPRGRGVPRALREEIAALESLVSGQLALEAGGDARTPFAAYATYVRGHAGLWPEAMQTPLAEAATVVDPPADVPEADRPTTEEIRGRLQGQRSTALVAALALEDRNRRCWSARSLALGGLAADHARERSADLRARQLDALLRRRFTERQNARAESAGALATLDGDALVQAALPLIFADGELPTAEVDALRAALARYASSGAEPDRDALRAAGQALAGAGRPAYAPPAADHAARAATLRTLYQALAQNPQRGARAIEPVLAAENGALSGSSIETATWRSFAEACH